MKILTILFMGTLSLMVACGEIKSKLEGGSNASTPMKTNFSSGHIDRKDLTDKLERLHRFYIEELKRDGVNRPEIGLYKNGKPDFEGIAAWILDVYLNEFLTGVDCELAWEKTKAAIQNAAGDEWKRANPGKTPERPPSLTIIKKFDRHDVEAKLEDLHRFYITELKRDGVFKREIGLYKDGKPDFEGIGTWIMEIYLNRLLEGKAPAIAWQYVVYGIQMTGEWKDLHPGVLPTIPTGEKAPLPEVVGEKMIKEVGQNLHLLQTSCQDKGGNNNYLYEVIRRLRATGDKRWGLNWKRGIVNDLSPDAISYYRGPGLPSEGADDVYIIDILGGHCGDSPQPAWTDVTRYGPGKWTLEKCPNCN
ncbi:MAG: hypothetical protein AB7F59_04100 [Bdellovibrionales bacterium]